MAGDRETATRSPIYVDIDDVLCETTREILRLAKSLFGRVRLFDQMSAFDLRQSLSLEEDQHQRLLDVVESDETIERYHLTPGAVRCLELWAGRGYRLHVVTGRRPSCEAATRRWLDAHAVPYDELLFVDKYGRHEAGRSVGLESLARMSFCLAVEDSLETAQFLDTRVRTRVALLSRPWNAAPGWSTARMVRVDDWASVMARFSAP